MNDFFKVYRGYIYRARYAILLLVVVCSVYFLYKTIASLNFIINWNRIWSILNSNVVSGVITGVVFSGLFSLFLSHSKNKKTNQALASKIESFLFFELTEISRLCTNTLISLKRNILSVESRPFPNSIFKIIPNTLVLDLIDPEVSISILMFYSNIDKTNALISELLSITYTMDNTSDRYRNIEMATIQRLIPSIQNLRGTADSLIKSIGNGTFSHKPLTIREWIDMKITWMLELG